MYEYSCRICLKNSAGIPIFGDEIKPDISLEITTFGNVPVREGDELPKFICEQCFKNLELAISFREAARRSDIILRRWRKKRRQASKTHSSELKKPCTRNSEQTSTSDTQNETNILNTPIKEGKKLEIVSHCSITEPEKPNIKVELPSNSDIGLSDADNDQTQLSAEDQVKNKLSIKQEIEVTIECEAIKEEYPEIQPKKHNYVCKYCDNECFELLNEYEEHRDTVQHKKNYIKSFLPKKKIDNRIRETLNPKDRFCEFCDRYFTKLHFPRHMKTEHKIILKKR